MNDSSLANQETIVELLAFFNEVMPKPPADSTTKAEPSATENENDDGSSELSMPKVLSQRVS